MVAFVVAGVMAVPGVFAGARAAAAATPTPTPTTSPPSSPAPPASPSPLASPIPPASGWTQFQGDAGHSGAASGDLAGSVAPALKPAWTLEEPGSTIGMSGAVIAGDVAVAVGVRGVFGVDLATGSVRWTVPRDGGPLAMPAIGSLASSGTSSGEVLVFTEGKTSDSAAVVGTDLGSRKELWRTRLHATSRSGVTIDGGTAFLSDNAGRIYAIDTSNGSVAWTSLAGGQVDAPVAVADGVVVAVERNTSTGVIRVDALDESTGKTKWEFAPSTPPGTVSSPAVAGSTAVLSFGDLQVRRLALAAGTVVASDRVRNALFSPLVAVAVGRADAYVSAFGPSADESTLYAIDLRTGSRLWDYGFDALDVLSSPVVVGRYVYMGLSDGRIVAVDRSSGDLAWEARTGAGAIGPIAVGSGVLVVAKAGRHGGLRAFVPDPAAALLSVPSPTELRFGHTLVALAAALGAVFAGGFGLLRASRIWLDPWRGRTGGAP